MSVRDDLRDRWASSDGGRCRQKCVLELDRGLAGSPPHPLNYLAGWLSDRSGRRRWFRNPGLRIAFSAVATQLIVLVSVVYRGHSASVIIFFVSGTRVAAGSFRRSARDAMAWHPSRT